jgi:hydrogenase maturation protease
LIPAQIPSTPPLFSPLKTLWNFLDRRSKFFLPSLFPFSPKTQTIHSVPQPQKTTLILGLGNDILTDDAIGLQVARAIQQRLAPTDNIDVKESAEMGLSLLDLISGYRDLVVVDAVQTGRAKPGFIHELTTAQIKAFPTLAPHGFGIGEALALGAKLQMQIPQCVRVLAIEVEDPFTLSHEMTPAVQGAVPIAAERALAMARQFAAVPPVT